MSHTSVNVEIKLMILEGNKQLNQHKNIFDFLVLLDCDINGS